MEGWRGGKDTGSGRQTEFHFSSGHAALEKMRRMSDDNEEEEEGEEDEEEGWSIHRRPIRSQMRGDKCWQK